MKPGPRNPVMSNRKSQAKDTKIKIAKKRNKKNRQQKKLSIYKVNID